jgi:hypothetical protein
MKGKWGKHFYAVEPGTHQITVFWKAFWLIPVNKATTTVSLAEGFMIRLQYYAPRFILSRSELGWIRE